MEELRIVAELQAWRRLFIRFQGSNENRKDLLRGFWDHSLRTKQHR